MYFIIADDLTGATDTGIQFQKRGIATTVLVEPPKETWPCLGENSALSINASSRELRPQEAAVRTREVLQHIVLCDQDTLFKKVDSLMRGNPVEELEAALEAAAKAFDEITGVLGLMYNRKKDEVPAEVTELVEKRAAAKKAKDWAAADAIRAQLTEMGWAVKDTAQGPQLSKI